MQLLSSRRLRAAVVGVAILGVVFTGCASDNAAPEYSPPPQNDAALPNDTLDAMKAAVNNALDASGASGAVVGVWVPWSGSWVSGIGTERPGAGAKINTGMAFRVADVTRLMTCDVLYGLADDGVVELDALVTDYVAGVADLNDITLLDLCNGTGGTGSSEPVVKTAWLTTPERRWTPLELASYGLGVPRVPAHTTYRDSDAGYLVLGLALERASSMTSSELISKYVTKPLGLQNTSLPDPAPAPPSTGPVLKGHYLPAVDGGYNCAAPVDTTTISSSVGYTDSGAVSTIADLGRYAQAVAGQSVRVKDKPDRYGSPLPAADGAPSWLQATGGAYLVGSMIGQYGWTPGYATAAFSDPATGFTVAVVLNDSTSGGNIAGYLAWELAAIASKAPAASGQTAPEFALPFTAEQYHKAISDAAITCVTPAEG